MEKLALKTVLSPGAIALSCLLVPAVVHCRLVQMATPFPEALPISKFVIPNSSPEPELKATVSGKLPGKPTVDKFPNASRELITGCTAKGDPTRVTPPGCVVKASRSATPGPTTTPSETTLLNPVAAKRMVMVSATL